MVDALLATAAPKQSWALLVTAGVIAVLVGVVLTAQLTDPARRERRARRADLIGDAWRPRTILRRVPTEPPGRDAAESASDPEAERENPG